MFGRDPVLSLNTLLGPKMRYLGNDYKCPFLRGHEKYVEKWHRTEEILEVNPLPSKLQPGDTVLAHNHTRGPFNPKYVGDYCVVSLQGNQIKVQPLIGEPMEMKHIKHVKYILPVD